MLTHSQELRERYCDHFYQKFCGFRSSRTSTGFYDAKVSLRQSEIIRTLSHHKNSGKKIAQTWTVFVRSSQRVSMQTSPAKFCDAKFVLIKSKIIRAALSLTTNSKKFVKIFTTFCLNWGVFGDSGSKHLGFLCIDPKSLASELRQFLAETVRIEELAKSQKTGTTSYRDARISLLQSEIIQSEDILGNSECRHLQLLRC